MVATYRIALILSAPAGATAQQIVEAFPDDSAPRYPLRDRDGIYGDEFRRRVKGIGIAEILAAPRSPWQNAFVERMIGNPPRGPRPRHRPQRATRARASAQLLPLLPRLAHAPRSRQGRARTARGRATRSWSHRRPAPPRRPSTPLRPPRGIVPSVSPHRLSGSEGDLRSPRGAADGNESSCLQPLAAGASPARTLRRPDRRSPVEPSFGRGDAGSSFGQGHRRRRSSQKSCVCYIGSAHKGG